MNAQRRKDLSGAVAILQKIAPLIDEAKDALQFAIDGEQDALDALPDSLRDGEKGEATSNALISMQEALDELQRRHLSVRLLGSRYAPQSAARTTERDQEEEAGRPTPPTRPAFLC